MTTLPDNYVDFVAMLRETAEGLLYISESEYPVEVLDLAHEPGDQDVDELIERLAHSHIWSILEPYAFFAPAIRLEDWMNDHEKLESMQFRKLLLLITGADPEAKVYKSGLIRYDIYLIGRYNEQFFAIHTQTVET
jgi:Nuclease A inhibitor-like protein